MKKRRVKQARPKNCKPSRTVTTTNTASAIPDVSFCDTDDWDIARDPDEMLAEIAALNVVLLAVDKKRDRAEAVAIVHRVVGKRLNLTRHEDFFVTCAMHRIVGEPLPDDELPLDESKWTTFVLRTVLRAWLAWARGQEAVATEMLRSLKIDQKHKERVQERTGAVHLMALYFWASAVEALAQGDRVNSLKLWKRAMEVGSTVGTESALLVQWSYAASFLPS